MTPPVAFSPYDYRIHGDPYPAYARLRDEAPPYRNAELDFWALPRRITGRVEETLRYDASSQVIARTVAEDFTAGADRRRAGRGRRVLEAGRERDAAGWRPRRGGRDRRQLVPLRRRLAAVVAA